MATLKKAKLLRSQTQAERELLLNEILFDIPDTIGPNAKVVIDKKMVQEKLADDLDLIT